MSERQFDCDLILVGGGLATSLIAYSLKKQQPSLKTLILEKSDRLGGNHTWSFHSKDVNKVGMALVAPLISRSWDSYSVSFPKFTRVLKSKYFSVRSENLHRVLAPELNIEFGIDIHSVAPLVVSATDGRQWSAPCVIDGRGFVEVDPLTVGYQKFVGMEIELEGPHGLKTPLLMDATCEQKDGFRFFYLLPWDENKLLIEDTRYSNGGGLAQADFRREIEGYAQKRGWKIKRIIREEQGSLPIPLRSRYLPKGRGVPEYWVSRLVPCVGVRAGFFHPTTGYSFSEAVRIAVDIAKLPSYKCLDVMQFLEARAKANAWRHLFFRYLNRMLFLGIEPEKRYQILERFYTLPKGLIARFYAGRMWPFDYLRLLLGIPPIPIKQALKCLVHYRVGAPEEYES